MKRERLGVRERLEDGGGLFFDTPNAEVFSSGCCVLNCACGGGLAKNRVINIVGDKSTGKTLLAIEACANHHRDYPDGRIVYAEAEAAFDVDYAEAVGLPRGAVEFPGEDEDGPDLVTIEDVFESMTEALEGDADDILYIIDSLDALTSEAELERDMTTKGTYGLEKAKLLSQLFRRLTKQMKKKRLTLIVVSQVRDKIGVAFGKQYSRAGGRALDFYASQIIELAHIGRIKKTRKGVKRAVGVNIRARVEKNKIGPPFREAEFPIMFGYGVEDVEASINWLKAVKRLADVNLTESKAKKFVNGLGKLNDEDYYAEWENVTEVVQEVWAEIEEGFRPTRSKYGGK